MASIDEVRQQLGQQAELKLRTFASGATRDQDTDKLDFEGFLSPLALKAFAEYMHKHRVQSDGSLRDSDNWQKGIPLKAYMKSLWRHFFGVWFSYRQHGEPTIEELCGVFFNTQGAMHELIKGGGND